MTSKVHMIIDSMWFLGLVRLSPLSQMRYHTYRCKQVMLRDKFLWLFPHILEYYHEAWKGNYDDKMLFNVSYELLYRNNNLKDCDFLFFHHKKLQPSPLNKTILAK